MAIEGGCFCGELRYAIESGEYLTANCHCTMCRHASGAPEVAWFSVPPGALRFVSGEPQRFKSSEHATRSFCPDCGTHLVTRRPGLPAVIVKVGTLDDPSVFGGPQMAIFTEDLQPFHLVPEGLPKFEKLPPRHVRRVPVSDVFWEDRKSVV